jgi:hypothetical protein
MLAGCSDRADQCLHNESAVAPPSPGGVAETLSVAGVRLVLDAQLNRDFMPNAPADGRPMDAYVRLVEVDSLAIPAGVAPDHLWALQPLRAWSTTLGDDGERPLPYEVVRRAGCGPKWEPGTLVDAVVRVHYQNRDFFVIQRGARIRRSV